MNQKKVEGGMEKKWRENRRRKEKGREEMLRWGKREIKEEGEEADILS